MCMQPRPMTKPVTLVFLLASLLVFLLMQRAAAAQDCFPEPEVPGNTEWAMNNLFYHDGGTLKPIKLADPTILKIQDNANPPQTWFFLTGTDAGQRFDYEGQSLGIAMTNFVIYRSTNLVDWYVHSFVFDRAMQGTHENYDPIAKQSWDVDTMYIPDQAMPQRFFKRFGSPHMYYNPNNGSEIIYLTFSAAELFKPLTGVGVPWDNDLDKDTILDNDLDATGDPLYNTQGPEDLQDLSTQQQTTFVIWTEKNRLLQGKPWMTPWDNDLQAPFRTWFPVMYHYRINNTGNWKRDGGVGQAQANGDSYASIPTTGMTNYANRFIYGENETLGFAWHAPWGFHWAGVGPRAWPYGDATAFFDPTDNCSLWLGWMWAQRSYYAWDTNNIAAYPMLNGNHNSQGYRLADALYQNPNFTAPNNTQPLQLFFSYNPDSLFFGIPNGKIQAKLADNTPTPNAVGVAESAEIFASTICGGPWIFAMASRNEWSHPSYQIVYRRGHSLEGLHLPWSANQAPHNADEQVLLASNWIAKWDGSRDPTNRTNFGGAEHFRAYGRDYIVFHKHADTSRPTDEPRQVFIKELTWTTLPCSYSGLFLRLYDGHPFIKSMDANWYRAPDVPGLATPPVY